MNPGSTAALFAPDSTMVLVEASMEISTRRHGGGLVPFDATCNCPSGWRRPSLRLNRSFAVGLVQNFPENQQIGTYRCPDCRGLVILTVGKIDLTAPATSPV